MNARSPTNPGLFARHRRTLCGAAAFAIALGVATFAGSVSAMTLGRGASVIPGASADASMVTEVAQRGGARRAGAVRPGLNRPGGGVIAHPGWRPDHHPGWRPGWGGVAAGAAALGFVSAATAYAWAGSPPYPGACWYYTDRSRRQGYWAACPQ